MDEKDKKILAELLINSRIPLIALAKKVGVSREVATYRLQRLVKEGIITHFHAIINYKSINFRRYGAFLQLKNISPEKEREFFDYLTKHEFVTYAGPAVGRWSITFDIIAQNREHLELIIGDIIDRFSDKLENHIVMQNASEQEFYPAKVLGHSGKSSLGLPFKINSIKLDEEDKKILRLLSENSRSEYKELAEQLNLSANAIKYRIKNLEKLGVIEGYTISLDIHKLGYEFYNIQIKLSSQDSRNLNSMKQFLRQSKKVIYFYHYLGNENWDFDTGVIVKNSLDLRDLILELRNTGVQLKIHDIYSISEVIKPDVAPTGVFDIK
ncbi:MAG: winged helix-turn-helix transcriptional regulator [Nanoarchaeota archaeon]|nr:winged helix-turn-helix transcriptional regulator [Nanoarchaeota archaeon]